MSFLWLLGCPHPEDKAPPDTATATAETGTEVTGETGLDPCLGPEVALDGWDGDCDGWADEFGTDWPRLRDEAVLLMAGQTAGYSGGWGQVLAVNEGNDGEVWVVAGGYTYPFTGMMAQAPRTGQQVTLPALQDYDSFGFGVAVGRFANTGGFLVALGYEYGGPLGGGNVFLYGPEPAEQHPYDYLATVPYLPDTTGLESTFVVGDLDGDGWDELLFQEADADVWPRIRVMDGASAGPVWSGSRAIIRHEDPTIQNFGYFMGELADVTADGVPDIPIYSEEDGGRVWLVSGDVQGEVLVEEVASAVLSGEEHLDDAGLDAAAGDANGDGYLDLLVGAPLAADRWGKSYLVLGPITEDRALADSAAQVVGDWPYDWCGASQTFLPDTDGDGADEPVVACSRDKYIGLAAPGRIMGFKGPDMAGVLGTQDAAAIWVGDGPWDLAGFQVHANHDVDGDGAPDLVVTVPYDPEQGSGAVYLLSGPSW